MLRQLQIMNRILLMIGDSLRAFPIIGLHSSLAGLVVLLNAFFLIAFERDLRLSVAQLPIEK